MHRLEWTPMLVGPRETAQRAHVSRQHLSYLV